MNLNYDLSSVKESIYSGFNTAKDYFSEVELPTVELPSWADKAVVVNPYVVGAAILSAFALGILCQQHLNAQKSSAKNRDFAANITPNDFIIIEMTEDFFNKLIFSQKECLNLAMSL